MVDERTSRWAMYEAAEPAAVTGWRLETIVAAARHYPTNGIRVAPDGRLWITQVLGRHITSLDPTTNEQRVVVPLGGGLLGPDDLAFDRNGNTFVTEPHDDRVSRVSRDGEFEVWVEGLPSANGITISRSGRLFIDECRPNGRLVEIDIDEPNQWRVVIGDLGMPNALEMGPDGWLYLPEVSASRILAVDPNSGATRVAVDNVFAPSAVKFDHRGRLVVTEAGAGVVTVVDLATGERRVLTHLAPGLDNLAFADEHTMYVSSFVTGAIFRISLDDGASEVLSNPGLITANGLSQSVDGTLLVSDRLSIVEVDHAGSLRRIATLPVDMQFAIAGAVMTGDALCVLTLDGRLMQRRSGESSFREWSMPGVVDVATCIDRLGSHVLVGAGSDVLAVEPSGAVRRSIATGLRISAVAACDESVVVCERGTGTVALFDGGTATVWTGFADPAAVALTADAAFVAEEASRRIVRVSRETGERTVVATEMPFGSPLEGVANGVGPPSLCAAADSAVFVGCSGDASVRRLSST
ncbi:MAG TPA: hypothetical protein VM282_18925 [Acidimicrobiales bacterium]|nr:hypothetical protein [Acidimicrobiales bacterium]